MNWKDISGFIGKSAPILGTVLGGPTGAVVGALVASALGVENDPDSVINALQKDPSLAIKLKQIENERLELLNSHLEAMADIELKHSLNQVDLIKSAHTRETESLRAGDSNFTQNALAILGVLSFFGLSAYIVSNGLKEMSKEEYFIVGTVVGSIMMIGKDIYGYYFGSSSGSKEKNKHLSSKRIM